MEQNEDQASLLFCQRRLSLLQAENQLKKKENEALSLQLKTFKAFITNLISPEKEENSKISPTSHKDYKNSDTITKNQPQNNLFHSKKEENNDNMMILRKVLEFQHERIDHLEKENSDFKLKYEKLLFDQNRKDSNDKEYDQNSDRIDNFKKTDDHFNFFRSSSSFYNKSSLEKNIDGSNKNHMAQSRTLFARYSENSDELKKANKTILMLEEKLREITVTTAKQIIDLKAQLMKNNAQLIITTNKNGGNVEDNYIMEGNGIFNNSFTNAKKSADNQVVGGQMRKKEGFSNFEKEDGVENLNSSLHSKQMQMNRNNSELKYTKKIINEEGMDSILGISLKRKDSLLGPIEKIKNNSFHQKILGDMKGNKLSQSLNDRGAIFSYKK